MDHHGGRPETHLAACIEAQHGLFMRRQALDSGFTPRMIERRVADGRWLVVYRGLYCVAGASMTWESRLLAACLAGPAVASHLSAGQLWEFPGIPSDVVEVTGLRHQRRKPADVTWHESYHLTPRDITEIEGIPATRPVRTFLDLGWSLTEEQLEEVLNDGLRRNLLAVPAIWVRMEQLGHLRRGSGTVRRVLERHVPGERAPESVLETRFLQLIRAAGLPEPTAQHEVRVDGGIVARIDFAYPELDLAIELDGRAFHWGERRERRDRRRENALVARQWRVLRFDWDDVTKRADYVIETVADALRAAA